MAPRLGDVRGRWVVVTGAARGIGRATALAFAAKGARLIVADVDRAGADRLASELAQIGAEAHSYGVDVGDRPAMEEFAEWTESTIGHAPDVVVNNAGILEVGTALDTDWDSWDRLVRVNLWGVIHGSILFGRQMKPRGQGAVINLASASGLVGVPQISAYSVTKFGVVGLSQVLRAELIKSGITVTAICPGVVKTGIFEPSKMTDQVREDVRRHVEKTGAAPEVVAKKIVQAAERGPARVGVGLDGHALGFLARFAPQRASSWLGPR